MVSRIVQIQINHLANLTDFQIFVGNSSWLHLAFKLATHDLVFSHIFKANPSLASPWTQTAETKASLDKVNLALSNSQLLRVD